MFFKKRTYPDNDSINLIKSISGKRFSTISEVDDNGIEHFIGRGGGANIVGRDIVIISDGTETFRCTVESLSAGELLSGNGVRLMGTDREGNRRNVIAIYSKL